MWGKIYRYLSKAAAKITAPAFNLRELPGADTRTAPREGLPGLLRGVREHDMGRAPVVVGMLNRVATDAALKRLGEPIWRQNYYFACTYLILIVPICLAGLTGNTLVLVIGVMVGLFAWLYWFNLVRSFMKHYAEQIS